MTTERETDETLLQWCQDFMEGWPEDSSTYKICAELKRRIAADAKLESQQGSMAEPVGEIQKFGVGPDGVYEWPRAGAMFCMVHYEDHLQAMRARVPDGYVIVPKEPTKEMIKAAYDRDHDGTTNLYSKVWCAMCAAAPKPE